MLEVDIYNYSQMAGRRTYCLIEMVTCELVNELRLNFKKNF